MDTYRIKQFAIEARRILKTGVALKVYSLGFNANGQVQEGMEPQEISGVTLWNNQLQTRGFYRQWTALRSNISKKGVNAVCEEVAYTWFNRLMAINILQKNGLCEPIISYTDMARTPHIVNEARIGNFPQMAEENRRNLIELLNRDINVTEQFATLISAWCCENHIIQNCFGGIDDYTELLLPQNILSENGFIDMINHAEFISDEDYRSPELIGWLYQFYNSERKDEVYAKKGKFQAEDIPAATQIFTPNWIVKYMVQNTLGRIFLDNNPKFIEELSAKWKYLVTPSEPTPAEVVYHYNNIEDLKVADLACGSGHILIELFELLFEMYIKSGNTRRKAITNILTKNLLGIDIDTRAKQLATFSLLLKACQKDRSFVDAHCMPRVYDMPECDIYTWKEKCDHMVCNLKAPAYSEKTRQELEKAFDLMKDAKSLGSIMKFDISDETREFMEASIDCYKKCEHEHLVNIFADFFHCFNIILALTDSYASLVMNPPYMGSGKMNGKLKGYIEEKYAYGKADLFSTFMLLAIDRLDDKGKYGMISMQSWMFLSSFSKLRECLLDNYHIESLLHLGPRTFDELSGEVVQNVAFVVEKNELDKGNYYRLVDGKDCGDKERMFLAREGYYPNISQQNFEKIPGSPIGYWVSEKVLNCYDAPSLGESFDVLEGLITSDIHRFLRFWTEVSKKNISFTSESTGDTYSVKWYPYCKGGGFRKWYGLCEVVVDWEDDGRILRNLRDERGKIKSRPQNIRYYFKEGITFSSITSGGLSMRYMRKCIFGGGGHGMFSDKNILPTLGFLNSNIANYLLDILNPTLNVLVSDIVSLPKKYDDSSLTRIVQECIDISKVDWDAHETSWDFQTNELVARIEPLVRKQQPTLFQDNVERSIAYTLEDLVEKYKTSWNEKFFQLHANEEELNRQFIEIYGLQDELTPEVPLSEVTILQQGEISIVEGANGEELQWNDDNIIKQLISYAIGCMMGRYSIDKPGLILANQGDDERRYNELVPNSRFEVDSNGIVPLMSSNMEFTDNATARFKKWLSVTFGEDNLTQNLNYIEGCLNKSIDVYFANNFWRDHKKMYQNRPIYWLFASRNRAFQCLVYMHRMTPFTVETIRTKYLLPYITFLNTRLSFLLSHASKSSSMGYEIENVRNEIEECEEYHDRLAKLAEDTQRTKFDLDDGVVTNYKKYGDILAKI